MNVLVVDDEPKQREILRTYLTDLRVDRVHEAENLEAARRALQGQAFDLALIDVSLSKDVRNRDGLTFVKDVVEQTTTKAVCVTDYGGMPEIRSAMRSGAYDYILKDGLLKDSLRILVERLRERQQLEGEVRLLRARLSPGVAPQLIGPSAAMQTLRRQIEKVATSDRPVLILGPTGAGKEVVAQAIHAAGPTPTAPQIPVNCAGFSDTLAESELFGHKRGSFTGAEEDRKGVFELAGKGSLFLDELAEMPLATQAKLLRALETRRFRPIGAAAEKAFEGRFLAATHADLPARVRAGTFRQDLYYRLDVATVVIPSLEERREDIPSLVAHFVAQQRRPLRFTEDAIAALVARPWPGNVRELRNVIDRVGIFAENDTVTAEVLERAGRVEAATGDGQLRTLARLALNVRVEGDRLDAFERAMVEEALEQKSRNITAAGGLLGVGRKSVSRRIKKWWPGLFADDEDDDA